MTIIATWIAQNIENSENKYLVVASDSRVTGGGAWDCCPKIFPLGREDSVIAFCGTTNFTYPLILQVLTTIKNYRKALSRELDICELAGHILKMLNGMLSSIKDAPFKETDFKLILAGFSQKLNNFCVWEYRYDDFRNEENKKVSLDRYEGDKAVQKKDKLSIHRTILDLDKAPILFFGDRTKDAMEILLKKLSSKRHLDGSNDEFSYLDKRYLKRANLGLIPLQVIAELSTDSEIYEIGGAPQIFKVYSYIRTLPFNVLWPYDNPRYIAHLGRPLLDYESSIYGCYDLRDLSLYTHQKAIEKILQKPEKEV